MNETDNIEIKPPRGDFPRGPSNETIEARRERYEAWIMSTGPAGRPDYEYASVRFYRGQTKRVRTGPGSTAEYKTVPAVASRQLCITSRCWQCMGGGSDPNAADRITACESLACGLWHARPYRPDSGKSATPLNQSVDDYCRQCMGLVDQKNYVTPIIASCSSVTCAIWPARPGRNSKLNLKQDENGPPSNQKAVTGL